MSIEPGYSGQEFMPEALPRIARLRGAGRLPRPGRRRHQRAHGAAGADAGANLLVAGTAVFRDVPGAYQRLVELTS